MRYKSLVDVIAKELCKEARSLLGNSFSMEEVVRLGADDYFPIIERMLFEHNFIESDSTEEIKKFSLLIIKNSDNIDRAINLGLKKKVGDYTELAMVCLVGDVWLKMAKIMGSDYDPYNIIEAQE